MSTRIPHLLEPYLCLPAAESSLILLTGVLGASTNWLVLRYLYSFLANVRGTSAHHVVLESDGGDAEGSAEQPVKVVLLSFLRDYAFWKDNAARLGVDLDSASNKGRFVYVDGLSGLFFGGDQVSVGAAGQPAAAGSRGVTTSLSDSRRLTLSEPTASALKGVLEQAVAQQPITGLTPSSGEVAGRDGAPVMAARTVLVVDQIDLLVAASGDESLQNGLSDALLEIREVSVFSSYEQALEIACDIFHPFPRSPWGCLLPERTCRRS